MEIIWKKKENYDSVKHFGSNPEKFHVNLPKWDEDKKQIKRKVCVWDRKREILQEEEIERETEKKLREGNRDRASERLSERQRELDRERERERLREK